MEELLRQKEKEIQRLLNEKQVLTGENLKLASKLNSQQEERESQTKKL